MYLVKTATLTTTKVILAVTHYFVKDTHREKAL